MNNNDTPQLTATDNDVLLDTVISVLNSAYQADPAAIHALICNRVPCNATLADHPTVTVDTNRVAIGEESYSVGLMGIVNGICESICGRRVAVAFSEPDPETKRSQIIGFVKHASQPSA